MTRPVDNIWTCDCGKRGVPSEIGGALFDFQYVCKECVKRDNKAYNLGQIPKPIWIEDPSALVHIDKVQDKMQYKFVEFVICIPAKGLNDEELLANARNTVREETYELMKDIIRYGGEVKETIDRDEAIEYGLIEE